MANYTPSGNPLILNKGSSAVIRGEFQVIGNAMNAIPDGPKVQAGTFNYAVDTGAVNACVVTLPTPSPTAYVDGMEVIIKAKENNTGASTINVNGIGVRNIRRLDGTPVQTGDILAGSFYILRYNGTEFRIDAISSVSQYAKAAADSAAAASSSAGSAASSAATATTQAGIATTKADEASASAGTATTQAGIATTQAGIATTKASEALVSASNAATSANNAAISESNTAAIYDNFDDRYLGPKAGDPTTDNDGNPLLEGALYWSTTAKGMKIYNGSGWQPAAGVVNPEFVILREVQTATAGQTLFTLTNSYTVGVNALMVYLNGSRLTNTDYTETSTTSVTLATACVAGDEVMFEIGVVAVGSSTAAGNVTFNPAGTITSGNVQAAITELDNRVTNLPPSNPFSSSTSLAQVQAVALCF